MSNVTSNIKLAKSQNLSQKNGKSPSASQRNFFGYKSPDPHAPKKTNILGKTDLNAMLYKIKKYYNELNKLKNEKSKGLDFLKEQVQDNESKIIQLEHFQDIEFENENISVKNITTLKETKEEIQDKIEKLIEEKKVLDEKYKNETEYSQTLKYMITSEKNNIEKLNETLVTSQEKILAIKYAKKNFDANSQEHHKKLKVYRNVMKNLEDEMINLDQLMEYQKDGIQHLTGNLDNDEKGIEKLREVLKETNLQLEKEVKKEKETILSKIKETQEMKKNKINKESEYIKLILGIDIIKKYYIDVDKRGEEINNTNLLKSEDYKIFTAEKYNIYDGERGTVFLNKNSITYANEENKTEKGEKNDLSPVHTRQGTSLSGPNYINNLIGRSSLMSIGSTQSSKIAKISISEIQQKLDYVMDFQPKEMEYFYTKIINKTAFYQSTMNLLNSKIINLENRKDNYTGRVQVIMRHNYKNFEDLTKTNSRFKNFMEGYQKDMQEKREREVTSFVLNTLNEHFKNNADFPPPLYDDFFRKGDKLLSVLKNYYEYMTNSFKIMIKECKGQPDVKHVSDSIKRTNKMCKTFFIKNWIELTKTPKIQYIEDVLNYALNEESIKSILQDKHKIDVQQVKAFCEESSLSRHFYSIDLPIEKNLFYFFMNDRNTSQTTVEFFICINLCQESFKLGAYQKKSSIKETNGVKFKKSKIIPAYDFFSKGFGNNFSSVFPELKSNKLSYEDEDSYFSDTGDVDMNAHFEKSNFNSGSNLTTLNNYIPAGYKHSGYKNTNRRPPTTSTSGKPIPGLNCNFNANSAPSHVTLTPRMNFSYNSYDKKISNKFYAPFMEKRKYLTKLNENIGQIKQNTRKSAIITHYLHKKKKEIEAISNELIIYNNPNINLDTLSNNTYSNFVKYIISQQFDIKNYREAAEKAGNQTKNRKYYSAQQTIYGSGENTAARPSTKNSNSKLNIA